MTTKNHPYNDFLPEIISGSDSVHYKLPQGYVLVDRLDNQLKELFSLMVPPAKRTPSFENDCENFVLAARKEGRFNLVLYPWLNKAVYVLNEADFSFVRTSRNLYKITSEEQRTLSSAKLGVVGLSVGQSVAVTLAMERSFGTIKLVDFDHLDLSNLNRLRAGVVDLGLPKVVLVAREIAEIDPYLNIELYPEGLTTENLNDFVDDLDVLIDECDSLLMKIAMRKRARSKGIPVVMDTSDRGMIDVERFDLDREKPLFHGLVSEVELNNIDERNRLSVLFRLVGGGSISPDLAVSFFELNQTIGTWPQLASAVALGGGLATSAVRQILLNKPVDSGRWHFDPESAWQQSPQSIEKPSASAIKKDALAVEMELAFCGMLRLETTESQWIFHFDKTINTTLQSFLSSAIQCWFSLSNPSKSLLKSELEGVYDVVESNNILRKSDITLSPVSEKNKVSFISKMHRIFMDACYQGSDYHTTAVQWALLENKRSVWFGVPLPFLMLLSRKDVAKRLSALPEQNTISVMLMGIINGTHCYDILVDGYSCVEDLGAALGEVLYKNHSARLLRTNADELNGFLEDVSAGLIREKNKLLGLGLNVLHDIT